MTICIPYKDEVHKGLELKFALRSIEKYLTDWDRIILIGTDKPEFLKSAYVNRNGIFADDGICFIYQGDISGRKEFSVYSKLLIASHWGEQISDDFIYWNDDHILLKPLHVSEIKYWHNGQLNGRNVYNRELIKQQNTLARLTKPNPLNFDIHTPIIFNKYRFKKIFQDEKEEVCIKSLYSNFRADGDTWEVEGEFMEDCKIVGHYSKEEVRRLINNKLFFSTNAICSPTVEVLEELYPQKSKFEL